MSRPKFNFHGCFRNHVHTRYKDQGAARGTRSPFSSRLQRSIQFLAACSFAMVVFLSLMPNRAAAQEFRGTLSGSVTDSSGAVINNATVVAREIHTGTESRTVSDSSGQFVIPFLLPGDYTLTVTAQGFKTLVHSGVTLQAQEHPILNLAMTVGSVNTTVIVSGAPPLIDTANASVGQVISTRSVEDIPLNGRTPTTLTELVPGVITTAAPELIHPFDNNAGNEWSIGGTPNQVSEVLLDGAPDLTLLGALAYAPTEDSVAEVSVRPFDTDASFGHTIGGVINQVTKSGTNTLHGTLYEFGQVSTFDANTYFDGRNKLPTPGFHYNQYGLTVGGPVWIPKVYNGRNKLFFFFAWEGLKDETPATTTTTVPTAAEKTGNFAQTLAAGCSGGTYTVGANGVATCSDGSTDPNQLYNPFTASTTNGGKDVVRSAIPNNQITAAGPINPVALDYLNLFPAPNATSGVAADGQDNYISNAPSTDTYNNEFGRLDYNVNSRDHVFFDFRHNYRYQIKNNYFGNGITGTTLKRENWGSTLDNVFTLNPKTFFDTRLNWTFFNEIHGTPAQAFSPTSVGFPQSMNAASELLQLPYINFNTGGSCGSFTSYQCLGDTGSALDPSTSYQVFVDMVKILGTHTLKIGFDGRQYRISIQNFDNSSGNFTFNSSFVDAGTGAVAQTFGGDLASFELGLPSSGDYDLEARGDFHQYYVGTFVQDDWKVNNRLTLNFGLRFDIDTPFEERLGRTVNGFNPTAPVSYVTAPSFAPVTVTADGSSYSVSSINTLGGLTYPNKKNGAVYSTNNGFLSPRFGFSFAVNPKTVVRGGFGTFVQPETLTNLNAGGTYSSSADSNQEGFSASTSYVATTNNYLTPANTLSNPFPSGFLQPAGSSQGASTFLGQSISFLAPKEHDLYSERWDLGVQRTITSNSLLEFLYIGNHGVHLPIEQQNLNATDIQYLSHNPWRDQALATAYAQSVKNPFKGTLPSVDGVANSTSVNTSSTVAFSNLIVPYPQFGSNNVYVQNESIGQSWFNSGVIDYQYRTAHGLTLTANYGFSKLIEADTFLNDEDTVPVRRISPFDHVHHFTVGGTYALPIGRGKLVSLGNSRLADELLGGFVINGVYQFQTGAPIEFSADIPLQPGANIREIKNKPRNTAPVGSGNPALSTNLFVTGNATSCPSAGACDGSGFINGQYTFHYRTLPQTLSWVRQDGYNNLDASVLKDFSITKSTYFQLRFETFNTLNHAVFSAPNVSSATASNFGYITSTISNSTPRQVQIGGRIVF
jgi:Carboxypeptidase regulatory-like domain